VQRTSSKPMLIKIMATLKTKIKREGSRGSINWGLKGAVGVYTDLKSPLS
jgi:hypothetical protein